MVAQVPSMSEALSLTHVTWCLTPFVLSWEVRQWDEKLVQSQLWLRSASEARWGYATVLKQNSNQKLYTW